MSLSAFVFTACGEAIPESISLISSSSVFSIRDPNTLSTEITKDTTVELVYGLVMPSAAKWCLSESFSPAPVDGTSPCPGPGSGWVTTQPATHTFTTGDGTRTLYLWAADATDVLLNVDPITANIELDQTGPTISTITGPEDGTYGSGDSLYFSVEYNEPVQVEESPYLEVTIESTTVFAYYFMQTSDNILQFRYTIPAGFSDLDGVNLLANVRLAGASQIYDVALNTADLSFLAQPFSLVRVDSVSPVVQFVMGETTNGAYKSGTQIVIGVHFTENVYVTGTPRLNLSITGARADYTGGASTTLLTFRYNVASGHNSADLDYASISALTLNGGSIRDQYGNNANLILDDPGSADSLGLRSDLVIDTTAPTVASVMAVPSTALINAGDSVNVMVNFNENIFVNTLGGTPSMGLNSSATAKADYTSGSGASSLTFNYTVSSLQNTTDLQYDSTSALQLNSGQIYDQAGNSAVLTLPALTSSASLGGSSSVVVDTLAPTITSVVAPANGNYVTFQNLDFSITFSEVVSLFDFPTSLSLNIGGTNVAAVAFSGSGTNTIVYRYQVAVGDGDGNGIVLTSPLQLNGGSIRDGAGNNLVITSFTPPNTTGVLVNTATGTYTPFDGILFVATYSGLGISYNGGLNFFIRNGAQGIGNLSINKVTVDEAGVILLATADNLYASYNDGDSFVAATGAVDDVIHFDVVSFNGNRVLAASEDGLYDSSNGLLGTWSLVGAVSANARRVAFDHRNSIAYALTTSGFYANSDSSNSYPPASWSQIPVSGVSDFRDMYIQSGGGDEYILLATDAGVKISTDGGASWSTYDNSTYSNNILSVSGDEMGRVYFGTNEGFYFSNDRGATFMRRSIPDGLGSGSIAKIKSGPQGYVFAATNGGASLSSDGGNYFTNRSVLNGLPGIPVRSIDYYKPPIIYALSANGPSVSKDGGLNFSSITPSGFPGGGASGDYTSIFVDEPADAIYVGKMGSSASRGFYRSLDGGVTYSRFCNSLDVTKVFVSNHGTIFLGTPLGLYRSVNNGSTCLSIIPSVGVHSIASLNGQIAVGTSAGFYYSTNDGNNWSVNTAPGDLPGAAAQNNVKVVFAEPDSNTYYIHQDNYKYTTGLANSWTHNNAATVPTLINDIFANGWSGVFLATSTGLAYSYDSGSSFTMRTTTEGLPSNDVRKVKEDLSGGALYVATSLGLGVSHDHGSSFISRTLGLVGSNSNLTDLYVVSKSRDEDTLLAGSSVGFSYSDDNGENFITPAVAALVNDIAFDESTPVIIATDANGIYTTDDGSTYYNKTTLDGLPSNRVYKIALDKDEGTDPRIFVGTDDGLAYSDDLGANFFSPLNPLAGLQIYGVVADEMSPDDIWVATDNRIYYSTDDGGTWTNLGTGAGATGIPVSLNAIYVDYKYSGARRVYAGSNAGFHFSTDDGATFTTVNSMDTINSIFVDERGFIYAATNNGFLKSTNGGATFTRVNTGLPSVVVNDIYVNQFGQIYLATANGIAISYNRGFSWVTRTIANGLSGNDIRSILLMQH